MSNNGPLIDEYWLVDEVMRRHPATIRVFLDYRMGCVGCPIGTFHTVEDACREHGMDLGRFLEELRAHGMGGAIPAHLRPAETAGADREP
jgi:hybrid cluster-associated redox disulfide protein